jgi:hypothetical protein
MTRIRVKTLTPIISMRIATVLHTSSFIKQTFIANAVTLKHSFAYESIFLRTGITRRRIATNSVWVSRATSRSHMLNEHAEGASFFTIPTFH